MQARSPSEQTYTSIPAGSSRRGTTGTSAWAGTQRENETQSHRSRPCLRPPPPRPPRPPHPHPRHPTLEASTSSGPCAHSNCTHARNPRQRVANQKGAEDHVDDERWNSVALAIRTKLARVQETPPLAMAPGQLQARVQYSTTGDGAWTTSAGAMFITTSVGG